MTHATSRVVREATVHAAPTPTAIAIATTAIRIRVTIHTTTRLSALTTHMRTMEALGEPHATQKTKSASMNKQHQKPLPEVLSSL